MTALPILQPKLRRSALEAFEGCPYRFNVLYRMCLCGHSSADHDHGTGECCGQTKPKKAKRPSPDVLGFINPHLVPCDCEHFRPVEDRGDESQRGIAFHEIAFRYIARLAEARLTSDAEQAALAFKEGIALTQVGPHLLPDVTKLWDRFTGWFELDLDAYLHAEERQETDRFTWIPDLVYIYPNNVTIKDWKTYYKGLTREQALKEFQLRFYLLQALDIWPNFQTYTFVFNFVRLAYEVAITLTPEQIEDFRPDVEAIVLSMQEAERTDNYPAIQGSHCGLCRLACPLADNPMKLPVRFTDVRQAEAAFGRVLTMEQELKALRKSLSAWCKAEGPLVYRGQEYLHLPGTVSTFQATAVIDFLRDRGVASELIDAIILTRGAMGDFGRRKKAAPAVTAFLDDIERSITRWSFRHRKAGEQAPGGLTDVLADDEGGNDGTED